MSPSDGVTAIAQPTVVTNISPTSTCITRSKTS